MRVRDGYWKQLRTADVKHCPWARLVASDILKNKGELALARIADGSEPCDEITGVSDDTQTSSQNRSPAGPVFDR